MGKFCSLTIRMLILSLVKAEKTIQSASGGFGFFSNKEQKYQDAADFYVQAANAFRMQEASQFASSTLMTAV